MQAFQPQNLAQSFLLDELAGMPELSREALAAGRFVRPGIFQFSDGSMLSWSQDRQPVEYVGGVRGAV